MKVVDHDVLLYAVNRDAPRRESALGWWESALCRGAGLVSFDAAFARSEGLRWESPATVPRG